MKGRTLLQYLIDISDITVAKKQEATEYLAGLEAAAQQSVQAEARPTDCNCASWFLDGTHHAKCRHVVGKTKSP